MLTLQFDGLFRCMPDGQSSSQAGILCFGWLIDRRGVKLAQGHGAFARGKEATSNVAEYLALIEGLEALADLAQPGERVRVRGDARGIIDQMRGKAAVNARSIRPLYEQARRLAQPYQVEWVWTPRRHNRAADALTRRAMRAVRFDGGSFQAALQAIDPRRNPRPSRRLVPLVDLRVYGV